MLDHCLEPAVSLSYGVVARFPGPVRRHLAIVDQSRLRSDCLKLALSMQPRRWRVADVATVSELVRRVLLGEEFDVILLGGSTCSQIDLGDISSLAAAVPQTPILVAADCDDPERAHAILRAGARGFLPASHSLKVLIGALERVRTGGTYVPLTLTEAAPDSAARTMARADAPPARCPRADRQRQSEQAHRERAKHVRKHGQGACQADHTPPQRCQSDAGGIARDAYRLRPLRG